MHILRVRLMGNVNMGNADWGYGTVGKQGNQYLLGWVTRDC